MKLESIKLENFRSYQDKSFKFPSPTTVIVGVNTAGKSNLLEAIFLIAFGRSPRADLDREMLATGEKLGFVQATVSSSNPTELEVALTENGKRFRVNGVGRRLAEFSRHFYAVLFSPEDLNLVTGSPDLRRRFMDFALGSVDRNYAHALSQYDKVRRRRNQLLKKINKGEAQEEELVFWDAKLLEFGIPLQDKRKEFFAEINPQLAASELMAGYLPSDLTADRLSSRRRRELAAQTTLTGPHRDDFSFLNMSYQPLANDGRDLSAYGSRGEQRKAVLALKSAELGFVERRIGSRPVLLLDDIFSELDEDNRAWVFNLLGSGGQSIIATTDLDNIPPALRQEVNTITL